jgi:hypothetical protein
MYRSRLGSYHEASARCPFEEGAMTANGSLSHVVTFCGQGTCGRPQLFVDTTAPTERRIVLTDDFGDRIRMSVERWETTVGEASSGRLTAMVAEHLVPARR